MTDLRALDTALFRWFNESLANPFLDGLMPLMSARDLLPVGFLVVAAIAFKLKRYGPPLVICLALIIGLGEGLVLSPLKDWIHRPRPPYALEHVRLIVGLGGSGSMPSSHAANWFCAVMILALYYRPSLWLTVPLACIVSTSRIYTGVHYPSDVLVGGLLGATYGWAGLASLNKLWIRLTHTSFPTLAAWLPTLVPPRPNSAQPPTPPPSTPAPDPTPTAAGSA